MDQKFRTSFIPRQEIAATEQRAAIAFRFSIFSIIALATFVLSIFLAMAVFFYQRSLVKSIDRMNSDMIAVQNSLDKMTVDSYIRMDQRLEAAKKIIASHNALRPVLALLEEKTLLNVRLKNFEYNRDPSGEMTISMGGEAINFITIASQSDLWSGEDRMIDPLFNDLSLVSKDLARFSFESALQKERFLYRNTFSAEAVASSTEEVIEGNVEISPAEGGILPSDI
ncbi:MAG: hypothetical protein A3B08_00255 [Candidatus Taylorbacteria bacterium RIFCSPLOWO2_01_FULL_43_44]|uniref:PilN domain-containing protein n=1 Tax=Candidatus Taylorbacteria bacterium RIFCSPHIGHO2_02_FULL_43_32b TaxID=1802306 RepID=A0A1G2MMJ1_9BACT|nr:MAG: hypothetical protein A2743_00540 [Candidatus Taylorbacteria bacterium RIFCSPHIGHO2_01_FULL_43_47]OHA24212.1 MAG: hypothetical protein A3C72_04935 [Candidatus Taylorbacteria bacterium RIFCSPHIGHO2_02_FULL_43_32b]OHA31254.1 MAG: hypothetical protein A3B08_00255 [Candidatus Taylorbacteria bacterium RIFCSPLOWO2_01_FULL_43_44]